MKTLSYQARTLIQHTGFALDHYRSTCPNISDKNLIRSSANSVIVQILEHGKMGDDIDLEEAILETEMLLDSLRLAQKLRSQAGSQSL